MPSVANRHFLQATARTLDFSEPVAIIILGLLNFVLDNADAKTLVERLLIDLPRITRVRVRR